MREDSGPATIITAFVLGALTGAAVALLMAPQSGEDNGLRRLFGDARRFGDERANILLDRGQHLLRFAGDAQRRDDGADLNQRHDERGHRDDAEEDHRPVVHRVSPPVGAGEAPPRAC